MAHFLKKEYPNTVNVLFQKELVWWKLKLIQIGKGRNKM